MEAAQHAEQQGVPLPKLALKHSVKSAVDADIAVTLVGMSSPEEVSWCDFGEARTCMATMTVVHQCRLQRCCSKAMVQPIHGRGGGGHFKQVAPA